MLRLLGQHEYGLYQLVLSVVSYLGLLSLGFSGAYMRFYSRYKAKNEDEQIPRLNGLFLGIFLIMGMVCIFCGIIMLGNVELIFGTALSQSEYQLIRILLVLMVLNLVMTFPISTFDAFIMSQERFIFQRMLTVLQTLLNPFIALPLLIMGFGSVGMVAVVTALTFVRLAVSIWYSVRKLKVLFVFRNPNFKLLKEMWFFTFFIFIGIIVDQLNWNVGKLLLGRMVGTAAVAVYAVGSQLNLIYLIFSGAISNVFIPQVNRIVAVTNDNQVLTKLFVKVGRIQFMVVSMVISGFIIMGQPFIYIWAGEGYHDSFYVALLLMVPMVVSLIQNLGIEIQRAKNMHQTRSLVYLVVAVINVFVSIPLIRTWGSIGAAMGTALSITLGPGLFMNWYYHKRIKLDMKFFWREIGKFIPALIAPITLGVLYMTFSLVTGISTLMMFGSLYVAVFCVSMWLLGVNQEEREMFRKIFMKMGERIRKKC
jgi:O-antigen/teichoic acid export membrane protein